MPQPLGCGLPVALNMLASLVERRVLFWHEAFRELD
jgi:hypothetical protein